MRFGTVMVTKDRNHCLGRTIKALKGSELEQFPVVLLNNGSQVDDPRRVVEENGFDCEYVDVGFNPGIVGSRILAHRMAASKDWTHYCFLQDDFELKTQKRWLKDAMDFITRFHIDYCRMTIRESLLGDNEHWVKGHLRVASGERKWNCSHIQSPKSERIGDTEFTITDKHYADWVHIISIETSQLLFGMDQPNFHGPTVAELMLSKDIKNAFFGALRSEFDFAAKHWLAYCFGLTSATGVVMERPCWCGLFDHFTGQSAGGYRDLPDAPDESRLLRAVCG